MATEKDISISRFLNPVKLLRYENVNKIMRMPDNKLIDFEHCVKEIFDTQFYTNHVPNDQKIVSGCEFICMLMKK